MEVVLVVKFDGLNGRMLGRSGVVSVENTTEEGILWQLEHEKYETVQEFTPGAIELGQARRLALEHRGTLPVYLEMGGLARRIG